MIVVYATAAFVILEAVDIIFPRLNFPDWTVTFVMILLAVGFPIALIYSWIFEISSKGIKKTGPIEPIKEGKVVSSMSDKSVYQDNSIIVLPFENISPDPDQDYFSDGLTEEIITDLSHIRDLLVISRGSAMTFKGTKNKIKEIAKEVNVRYALEGSVRKEGNNLRITAQLIDAETDTHLWAEKYNGALDNIFKIQEKVSRSIVSSLQLRLSPEENQVIETPAMGDVYAYECYLKANQEIYRYTRESLDLARQLIQNGLDIVGENELLYEAMGNAHIQYINFCISSDESHLKKADEWINKLVRLNPNSSQRYYLDGLLHWKKGDWKEGFKRLQKSLTIDSDNPRPREYLVYLSAIAGKGEASRTFLPRLLEIDPLTPLFQAFPGWIDYMEGNLQGALGPIRKMYTMEPNNPVYGITYAYYLTRIKQFDEAFTIIDKHAKKSPGNYLVHAALFRKFALTGRPEEALKTVAGETLEAMKWDEQFSWEMAANYALIDHPQEAMDWLENAVNRGFVNYPFLNEFDPLLNNIRSEPEFKKLMERVKNEWERFEV